MIVKIHASGKSFAGTAAYLTHDPDKAQTDERVAWTHTLNCANDHVPSAVDEMLWTARDAELLKQEAGIRAGGRATENPVKHVSLNWAPGENPTREHMIETTEDFLAHMKWQGHQAVLVAHDDKAYSHVHVMVNSVHPETGLHLDDNFERRRAQAWALDYEREHGIHCEQRLANPAERESSPPRNIWVAFQENEREFARAENARRLEPNFSDELKNQNNAEWKILKEIQKDERIAFIDAGKSEFKELRNSIYREVREEFRGRWADYYAAKENGADAESLAILKTQLVTDQNTVLEARRDEACADLRKSRDVQYRELLDDQRDARTELRWRQEAGLDNAPFLNEAGTRGAGDETALAFREAAHKTSSPIRGVEAFSEAGVSREDTSAAENIGGHAADDIGPRVGLGVGSLLDSLFTDLTGSDPRPFRPDEAQADLLRVAADETVRRERLQKDEVDDREREKRQRSVCE